MQPLGATASAAGQLARVHMTMLNVCPAHKLRSAPTHPHLRLWWRRDLLFFLLISCVSFPLAIVQMHPRR